MAAGASDRELTLRQLLRLVDLSRDVERANDDRTFVASNGEILYVMDQNIFEMFIRPFRHLEGVETFYGDIWAYIGEDRESWRGFEAQAAMIAAETLLVQAMPGSRSPHLLMTEPHRWELANRVDVLTQQLSDDVETRQDKVRELIKRKLDVLNDLAGKRARGARAPEFDDDTLETDLAQLGNTAAIDRVRVARRASAVLAGDEVTEPLEQLRRVTTWPIRTRLRALPTLYKPSPKDLERIEQEAEDWFTWIVRELRLPGHAKRPRAQNPHDSAKAIWNDARSLAYLRWVSNTCIQPGQRIVLVTGDVVLFDTYRRWHIGLQPGVPQPSSEPFLLRRATQYSPIFNPNDRASDLLVEGPGKGNLFSQIEQAIEAALLPIMLATADEDEAFVHGGASRRREVLALKLAGRETLADDKDLDKFSNYLSETWIGERREQIIEIRDMWQEALRVAIGASYDIFKARLNEQQQDIVEAVVSRDPQSAATAMTDYVGKLLGKLADDSAQLWLPLARHFIADPPESSVARRFSPLISQYVPPPGCDETAETAAESVFATAASRALEVQDVNNANRFAGLALRADAAARKREEGALNYEQELEYLHAVTFRFQIGAVGDHYRDGARYAGGRPAAYRSINEVKQYYARSSRLVDRCLSHHFKEARQDTTGDGYHRLRYLRALSERAALNLFMTCALGLARTQDRAAYAEEAKRFLETARGDLWLCWEKSRAEPIDADPVLLGRVTQQFTANIAAAEAINVALRRTRDVRLDKKLLETVPEIKKIAAASEPRLPLLRAELWAFMILAREREPGIVNLRLRLEEDLAQLKLPLDKELYRALVRYAL